MKKTIRSTSRDPNRPRRRLVIETILGGLAASGLLGQVTRGSRTATGRSFENDRIRAVHFRFRPRTRIPMHEVEPSLMIYLTDSSARFVMATGDTWEESVKAGEVRWWPGGRVRTEILSTEPIEFIQVVPK